MSSHSSCFLLFSFFFFFFNDTAPTEIYTLSLHDALPICRPRPPSYRATSGRWRDPPPPSPGGSWEREAVRSEEHTSELQSQSNLVCRLLLEKKKQLYHTNNTTPSIFKHAGIAPLLLCHAL